jgi:excisionase family DNA binding protein
MSPAEQAHRVATQICGAPLDHLTAQVQRAHRDVELYHAIFATAMQRLDLTPIEEPPLTVRQVAARLNVSESHVKELVREGKLPKIANLGATIRITPAALDAFMHHQEK